MNGDGLIGDPLGAWERVCLLIPTSRGMVILTDQISFDGV